MVPKTVFAALLVVLSLFSVAHAFSFTPSAISRLPNAFSSASVRSQMLQSRHRSQHASVRMQIDAEDKIGGVSRRTLLKVAGGGAGLAVLKKWSQGGSYTGTPNLEGKVAVVTGGNTGIGKQTCIRLASMGAEVILASRDEKRGQLAVEEVRKVTGSSKVRSMQLNLASLASVERFAAQVKAEHPTLDILVNNAGVMALPEREETEDGLEMQMGVNHFGHFALTMQLLPLLLAAGKATGDARVISVSSAAHQAALGGMKWEDLNAKESYAPWESYAQSKLANVLFAKELARRLPAGSGVGAAALHPGVIQTELGRSYFIPKELCDAAGSVNCKGQLPLPLLALSAPLLLPALLFSKTPAQGAETSVRLAADPALAGARLGASGGYFQDCAPAAPSAPANDAEAGRRLWELSAQLTRQPSPI